MVEKHASFRENWRGERLHKNHFGDPAFEERMVLSGWKISGKMLHRFEVRR